jgi:hypothetical protein
MMSPRVAAATRGGVSLLFVGGIAWLSLAPMPPAPNAALVRLSWRSQPYRVEECRTLSAQELASIPSHMRKTEECVGEFVDYEVSLEIDGLLKLDTVAPSGARRDRPVYVFQDELVSPGTHTVAVRFRALVGVDSGQDEEPPTLEWNGYVTLAEREIALVTLDATGTRLLRR